MSRDPGKCGDCEKEKERVVHPQSRRSVIQGQLKADTNLNIGAGVQTIYKLKNPNEYEDESRCANPTCEKGQKQFKKFLEKTNRGLKHAARLGDWTEVDKKDLNRLQQLSEKANEITTENEPSWANNEVKVDWENINDQINTFSTNLERAIETTDEVERESDDKVHGQEKVGESLEINKDLHKLNGQVDGIEAVADAEQTTNQNDENEEQEQSDELDEEEQGPIERREAEIETLKAEKQERIEAREKEIEEIEAKIDELKTEKQERIGWRQDEIEALGEGDEKQIEKLQKEIRETRKRTEKQIDTRRERIDTQRVEIEETRRKCESKIDTLRSELFELQEQEEEQVLEAEEVETPERDREEEAEADMSGSSGRGDDPPPTIGAEPSEQATDNTNRTQPRSEPAGETAEAEPAGAVANGSGAVAGNGATSPQESSQPTSSHQDGESKQPTESSSGRTFDPNRTLSIEEKRELERTSEWSEYNPPTNVSDSEADTDQTNDLDGSTREETAHEESSREENPENRDREPGSLV